MGAGRCPPGHAGAEDVRSAGLCGEATTMWLAGLCLVTFRETVPARRPFPWTRIRLCRNRHGDTRTSPRGQQTLGPCKVTLSGTQMGGQPASYSREYWLHSGGMATRGGRQSGGDPRWQQRDHQGICFLPSHPSPSGSTPDPTRPQALPGAPTVLAFLGVPSLSSRDPSHRPHSPRCSGPQPDSASCYSVQATPTHSPPSLSWGGG